MPKSNTKNVINKIISKRKELGYSYQDLADKTGLNKSTLMRYENGDIKTLNLDSIEAIAKGLGVTPAYLMGWEDEKENDEFNTPEAAMQFILKQPAIAAYGGFDVNKMSDDEVMEFANELLRQLKLLGYKYNK